MQSVRGRLERAGMRLPSPPSAAGAYVPVAVAGGAAYVSGQIPVDGSGAVLYSGAVSDANAGEARKAARLCALNVLAQLEKEIGSLDAVTRVVRIGGFVNSAPGFSGHPRVVNAASDVMLEAFGDRGRHARAAVGACGLPLNAMVEVEALVEFDRGAAAPGGRDPARLSPGSG